MGHFYDNSIIPQHLRRDFDVYERIEKLRLDLGTFESWINRDLKGANICTITFHESGLVYISGYGYGPGQIYDDPKRIGEGRSRTVYCRCDDRPPALVARLWRRRGRS